MPEHQFKGSSIIPGSEEHDRMTRTRFPFVLSSTATCRHYQDQSEPTERTQKRRQSAQENVANAVFTSTERLVPKPMSKEQEY